MKEPENTLEQISVAWLHGRMAETVAALAAPHER